ncbi:MAG: tRNA preQ1(34) S-adenosylmethionine ribosyltransferase-isomerase QueA [Hyphomicrobiales bacterium]|nr:tRNA preQ1(34) S-adenosylmethionine ribosyltransferase-isomerase QueA [Hyphomicrobiales bacterium]MBV9740642.1 tRNA preQ1(34) S-adenosylmethionine ribosyltransferase-isomerase QueA [Hyphomicrobiales bacterium]
MRVDLFDFELPEALIALRPASPRASAWLLVVDPQNSPQLRDRHVADLPDQLRPGDIVVLNDTRVIPARLLGMRVRGEATARVEILLHRRLGPDRWRALARPAKRLAPGDRIVFGESSEGIVCELQHLMATVESKPQDGEIDLAFDFHGAILDEAIERFGHMPLPPYIAQRRAEDARDRYDYQTVYARDPGAIAAPTAGLHLDTDLLDAIRARDIAIATVTLHVGPGTFLPVKAEDTSAHRMHSEWGRVDASVAEAINAARQKGGRIIAVGTTTLRLLESAALPDGRLLAFEGETAIFITPGYRFKVVDALMTNFHLPRSTLFMLVSAFAGLETMRRAYAHAIEKGYRFYSYGDASLLFRASEQTR